MQERFLHDKKGLPAGRQGQLLIEAMISVSILVVGLLGVFSVISQSLGLYRVAYEEYVAANLASEGIEIVKNIIDSNVIEGGSGMSVPWNKALDKKGRFGAQYDSRTLDKDLRDRNIMFNSSTGLYNYGPTTSTNTLTNFKREIVIDYPRGDKEIQVNSIVTWTGRGGFSSSINLESHFFDWRS